MSVSFWIDGHDNWETDPNFSNTNAREVCDILGIAIDYGGGTIHPSEFDRVIRISIWALNNDLVDYGRQTFEDHAPGCARVIVQGTSDESVRIRIRKILALLLKAKEINRPVNFG